MVLPAPAPHDEAAPGEAGWIDELTLALRLSKGAILLHVDHACPTRLGELVRALAREHPTVDVAADVRAAMRVPEGSVLVLLPKGSDADWLNLQRPVFKRRELKVVLFCDRETSIALAQDAPDFFDWISVHQDCPPGPAAHAVLGLRAALAADAPVVWTGPGKPEAIKERVGSVFSAAFPGQTLRWVTPTADDEELLGDVREAGEAWVACFPRAPHHLFRFQRALVDAGRRSRALVVTDARSCPGYWPVHDRMAPFVEARRALEGEGAARAGALAALTGLEPEAVELARALLRRGEREERLVTLLATTEDPGAVLTREVYNDDRLPETMHLLSDVAEGRASPNALRAFGGDPQMERLRAWHLYRPRPVLHQILGKPRWVVPISSSAEPEIFSHFLSTLENPLPRVTQHYYAVALAERREDDAALAVLDKVIALEGRVAGIERDGFTVLIPTLAEVLTRTGRAIQAEALLRKLLGPDACLPREGDFRPPDVRGVGMSSESEGVLALFLAQPSAPALPPSARVGALRLLAEAWIVQGRYEDAHALLDRALGSLADLPAEHREQWRTRAALGRVLALEGRLGDALDALRGAAARAEAGAGAGRLDHARILADVARVERRLATPEAASTARRALELYAEAGCSDAEKATAQQELQPIAATVDPSSS
jgi:tetratricopeptide (TPR) repeat protein